MSYELISEEDYAGLPDEDDKCFVEFESICRRNMTRMIDNDTSPSFDRNLREQYMSAVAAVAAECSVPNIVFRPSNDDSFYENYSLFCLEVQGEVARIRIRQRGERHPYSVLLTATTRTKIEHYVSRIRDIVDKSDLDPDRKRRLGEKLDNLAAELSSQRLSFAKTMAILAAVVTTMGAATTIAAEGHGAVTHIMQLIGQDKESEDAAAHRLSAPPKALPKPPVKKPPPASRPLAETLDDDIPF